MITPSQELTLAAERLEALDAAAFEGSWDWEDYPPLTGTWQVYAKRGFIGDTVAVEITKANAALIAAMRGVAKPLAAWLRSEVRFYISGDYTGHALILAREVIRATGGPGDER